MKSWRHVSAGIALAALVCGQLGCRDNSQSQNQTPAATIAADQETPQEQTQTLAVTTTTTPSLSFVGKSEAEILAELGLPQGKLSSKGRTVWTYERGSLEFTNGVVAASQMMSLEQYAEIQQAKQKRVEEARANAELQWQRDALTLQSQAAAAASEKRRAAIIQDRARQRKESEKGYVSRSTVIGGEVISSVATETPAQRAARTAAEERYRKTLNEINDKFRTREREDRAIYEAAVKSQPYETAWKHYEYLQQQTSDAKRDALEQARIAYENELSQIPSGN